MVRAAHTRLLLENPPPTPAPEILHKRPGESHQIKFLLCGLRAQVALLETMLLAETEWAPPPRPATLPSARLRPADVRKTKPSFVSTASKSPAAFFFSWQLKKTAGDYTANPPKSPRGRGGPRPCRPAVGFTFENGWRLVSNEMLSVSISFKTNAKR